MNACVQQESLRKPDLRLGRWQDVLSDVRCDALIFDAPYSNRTHAAVTTRADECASETLTPSYAAFTRDDCFEVVTAWHPRCRGWIVSLTDSVLVPAWQDAYESVGRYAFAPVPCVIRGMSVRIQGDGPSSWTIYAVVSRPRTLEFSSWGTLPGAYVGGTGSHGRAGGSDRGGGRGKPAWLMNALVRDYSRAGDVVCDPFAGYGSTLSAALGNGRSAIGAEVDPEAFAEAQRRLCRPLQTDLLETMNL